MVLKIKFPHAEHAWIVQNQEVVRQTDGISCGPLACFRILLLFGYENLLCQKVLKDYKQMRITVMDHWNAMLERNKSDMYCLVGGRKYTKAQEVLQALNESEKVAAIEKTATAVEEADNNAFKVAAIEKTATAVEEASAAIDSFSKAKSEEVSEPTMNETPVSQELVGDDDHVAQREASMTKRNARQEQMAQKAMKQYQDGVKKLGVSSGAIVTLKVDFRVHYHASGLVGVVYNTKDTGGVLVVCEHGVITSSGSTKDFWVPNDQYKVVAVANENAPISTELQQVREKIMNGTYDYSGAPRISYAKYHDLLIGASSPTKRSRCGCKKGCKKSTCGCLKKGLTCHSGCGCNGNCENDK
jgi:soluble cytochrome b562